MILHTLEKGLCRLGEDNLIVCFHDNRLFGWLRSSFFFWIQLKLMKPTSRARLTTLLPPKINKSEKQDQRDLQIQALVADITVEIKGYCYLKLSPSRFRHLKRWLLHDSCWVLETWVKLKHHTLNYDTQIFIVCRTDIYSPLVGVVPTYKGRGKQLAITLNSL